MNKDNCLGVLRLRICIGIALAIFMTSAKCFGVDTFVISDSANVEDVALRDREYSAWNFGAGHFLEAGFMPGLYEIHHAASLVRFNLSGLTKFEIG